MKLIDGKEVKPGRYLVLVAKQAPRKQAARHPTEEEQITILSGPEGFRNSLPALYSDKARCPFVFDIKSGPNELPPLKLSRRPEN